MKPFFLSHSSAFWKGLLYSINETDTIVFEVICALSEKGSCIVLMEAETIVSDSFERSKEG